MLQQQPHKLQKESLTNRYAFSKLIASTMHQKPFFPSLSVQKIHIKMWYNLQYWESCISFFQKNSFPFWMENQRSNQKLHLKYDIFSLIGRNICFPVNLILCCKKIHFIKQFFCKQTIPENHGPEMRSKTNVEKSEQLNSKIIYCNSQLTWKPLL